MIKRFIFPLILLAMPFLLSGLLGGEILDWCGDFRRATGLPVLKILPLVFLFLPTLPALLFNQTRIVLLALMLAGYFIIDGGGVVKSGAYAESLLVPVFAVQALVLTYLRERGLINRFGLLRIAIAFAPLLAIVFAGKKISGLAAFVPDKLDWIFANAPYMGSSYLTLLLVAVCIVMLMRLRGTEYPVLAPAFAVLIMLALLAFDGFRSQKIFDKDVFSAACIVTAGVSLLWCVFRLSWGRAFQDELTGLPGRRALEEKLAKLGGTYSLAMADVDHFKKFNDNYGHDAGDDVLRLVSSILKDNGVGKAYRYGGEEFTIVCSGYGVKDAAESLEDVRQAIADARLTLHQKKSKRGKKGTVSVTVSFGVAERGGKNKTPKQVIVAADKALYKAKKSGRNRICV